MDIEKRLAQYKPTKLEADLSHLSQGDQQALQKLVAASKIIDSIYFKQLWKGCLELKERLQRDSSKSEKDALLYKYFMVIKGPWDASDDDNSFIEGVPKKPLGSNVYPEDMTKEEFLSWVDTLCEDDKKRARGFYDVIERDCDGKLQLKGYNEAYKEYLEPAAQLLQEASELVSDASLSAFLLGRSKSFIDNDYVTSEISWLKIAESSPIEVAIGPYEVYKDNLFSSKSFYESFIHVRDFDETKNLAKFTDSLQFIESHLPVPDKYKNTELKKPTIVVVNEIYSGGDTSVPMTAAYNLPNDEEAIKIAGAKLTLIKNVQYGKFESVLTPISNLVLVEEQQKHVDFGAFFTHVLLHEVAHSNGPHHIVDDSNTTVRSRMEELHSTLEEAKADITGLFAASLLVKNNTITGITLEQFYVTYLASAFRSIRFGLNEAHGRGQAIQLNYLVDNGGFEYEDGSGKVKVNFENIETAVSNLTRDILIIQGNGSKEDAANFVEKYGNNREKTIKLLDLLADVPIDIQPIWREVSESAQPGSKCIIF